MESYMHSFLDLKAESFLKSVPIKSIMKTERELITLSPDDSVEKALKTLSTNAITAAPVFDPYKQRIVGYLSVLDLCVWIVRTYNITKGDKQEIDRGKVDSAFLKPIWNLLDTGMEQYWPINQESSLETLINSYFKWRIHRTPVIDQNKIIGHISQSDVTAFLYNNANQFQKGFSKKLCELGLDTGPILSIPKGRPLIQVFNELLETKFTGLAILDEQGRLYNNISASDLKGITKETFFNLETPIEQIIRGKKKLPPVTCTKDDTIENVIKIMVDYKVHRIYVVDDKQRPTNVITHTTIMKLFFTYRI